jgi:hypothetical protein
MTFTKSKEIANLLVTNIPQDLLLAIQEALIVGAERAYNGTKQLDKGHVKNARGQMRHFEQNQAFHSALLTHGIDVSELSGNKIVVGRIGIWNIARGTANDDNWHSLKRSKSRQLLAQKNAFMENLVYGNLFDEESPKEGTVFFISSFSKNADSQLERPISIQIAVCDKFMNNWLFIESIEKFIERYNFEQIIQPQEQKDLATPALKSGKQMYGTSE